MTDEAALAHPARAPRHDVRPARGRHVRARSTRRSRPQAPTRRHSAKCSADYGIADPTLTAPVDPPARNGSGAAVVERRVLAFVSLARIAGGEAASRTCSRCRRSLIAELVPGGDGCVLSARRRRESSWESRTPSARPRTAARRRRSRRRAADRLGGRQPPGIVNSDAALDLGASANARRRRCAAA